MDASDPGLSRRRLCTAALLSSGLGVQGAARSARASYTSFEEIFHFPRGDRAELCPLPSLDKRGRLSRINVITALQAWQLSCLNSCTPRDTDIPLHSNTYSHLVSRGSDTGPLPRAYGTELVGGKHGAGAVVWCETAYHRTIHNLYTLAFDGSEGLHPMGGVIEGFDGALYGTAREGGLHGGGVVFRVTTAGEFSVLHHFDPANGGGWWPVQCPTCGSDGRYYGLTLKGGRHGRGSLWSLSPGGEFESLHSFGGRSGDDPDAALCLAPDGRLYGVTSAGGDAFAGTVFSYSPADEKFRLEAISHFPEMWYPAGKLCALPDGSLYGPSQSGGGHGNIFRYIPSSRRLETVRDFDYYQGEGYFPQCGMALGADGALYGVASQGGAHNGGTLYRLVP